MKLVVSTGLIVVVACGVGAGYVNRWNNTPLGIEPTTQTVVLQRGEPFSAFAHRLSERNLVTHPRLWSRLVQLRGLARQVRAGEYVACASDTPETLLQRLISGDVLAYEVRLIEGWTAMQALAALHDEPRLAHTLSSATVDTLLGALGLPDGHAEGLFYPDTYRFVSGDSDADILGRAYVKMQDELAALWEQRADGLPYTTAYEALIVASLVEKETGRDEDRGSISQVFASRMHKGMRLQTDPSVIYGLGEAFDGNLTRRDLRRDTPYNTYVHRGLPPSPIALPGRGSIEAALHPADGEYLYFVARGDGSSQFSTSLAEHRAAVRKYQLH